jgi:hypothetical protein
MSLRRTAAKTVGGAITVVRVPAETTLGLVGRTPLGGAIRAVAGRLGERERTSSGTDEVPAERPRPERKREERPKPARRSRSDGAKASGRKRSAAPSKRPEAPATEPRQARPGEAVSGFPEPPGKDPGDISRDPEPHHALSNPVGEADPTEWPDPYDAREDPRDPPDPDDRPFGEEPHAATGSTSTSEPHPSEDPEAGERWKAPERDHLDD